jgi:hypothetical protein
MVFSTKRQLVKPGVASAQSSEGFESTGWWSALFTQFGSQRIP